MSFLSNAKNEIKESTTSIKNLFSPENVKTAALKTKESIETSASNVAGKVGVFVSNVGDIIQTSTNKASAVITDVVKSTANSAKNAAKYIYNSEEVQDTIAVGSSIWNDYQNKKTDKGNDFLNTLNSINSLAGAVGDDSSLTTLVRKYITKWFGSVDSGFVNSIGKAVGVIADSVATPYIDGVTETTFGAYMRDSWAGLDGSSFLNYFKTESGSKIVKILDSTPLDAGSTSSAIYGSMVLGAPYQFNSVDDPNNRTLINTFVRDAKYLSLTPGLPKYNGGQYLQKTKNDIYHQTTNPDEMLNYILRNGLDSYFSNKDKRYYTFEAKYEEYFSYLEAMLNPIWIKLGLANNGTNEFNIFSFFDIKQNEKISPENYQTLKQQYRSSIAFFTNPNSISEMVDNNPTGFGSNLASNVNSQSDEIQQINYLTGMGTGGGTRNLARKLGVGATLATGVGNFLSENLFAGVADSFSSGKTTIGKILKGAVAVGKNVSKMSYTQDMSQVIQQFATANGMKVIYPELWADSSYAKSININLSFTSPYGDPLSIFKYVYVPFCALLCFALPRQAAENGFVSPFFVRADIPGVITSDLALISGLSWTKGGSANLWTKDGLPRAIDVSFSIEDLYQYLAMTKHFSFLSANPSYTVFLDNMAGLCSINTPSSEDSLNDYFREILNRSTGTSMSNGLWNGFSKVKQSENIKVGNSVRNSMTLGNVNSPSWMRDK